MVLDKPLGDINVAEAAALTIIRGVHPGEREQALSWFKERAAERGIRAKVLRVLELYVRDSGIESRLRKSGSI